MDKMIAAQRNLKEALLVLAQDADFTEKHLRAYRQCINPATAQGIPAVIRKDYYRLADRFAPLVARSDGVKAVFDAATLNDIAPAVMELFVRLTEWITLEHYLLNQRVHYA
ncbi:hypothetical protein V1599_05670 [Enterobacter sp. ECC-175]|uniref:hypothetical protein n=1 Tax=Enterobacter sp. ECC-175 TaxID=3116479 RepID=UPI0037548A2A